MAKRIKLEDLTECKECGAVMTHIIDYAHANYTVKDFGCGECGHPVDPETIV